DYKPYMLDIHNEMKKLKKLLYYNPKWWILSLKTIIKNPYLLYLVFGTIIKKSVDKNILLLQI
ncbi:MAG: hypothetical protein ACFFBP_13645, partial [Promethearchaeota archaeon]